MLVGTYVCKEKASGPGVLLPDREGGRAADESLKLDGGNLVCLRTLDGVPLDGDESIVRGTAERLDRRVVLAFWWSCADERSDIDVPGRS